MKRKGLMRFLSTGMTSIVLMTSAFPTTVYAQPVTEEPETAMSVEESSEAGLTEGTEQSEDVEHTESEEQSQTQESEVQTTETAEETQETTEVSETETETETETDEGILILANQILENQDAIYEDGVYEGSSTGFKNGEITVRITIKDHKITEAEVLKKDKQSWWDRKSIGEWINNFIGLATIREVQQVDTVSGATYSSTGVKNAILDALSHAAIVQDKDVVFESGNGTKEDPYILTNAEQLLAFAQTVKEGESYQGKYIALESDIKLYGTQWEPIGTGNDAGFCGYFDGRNHEIKGMCIGSADQPADMADAGFFAKLGKGSRISRLGITDSDIYNRLHGETGVRASVGLLAGSMDGSKDRDEVVVIDRCWSEGRIRNQSMGTEYSYVGGLVGAGGICDLISNCWTQVNIETSGYTKDFVGGILGTDANNSAVMNSVSLGHISGMSNGAFNSVGGLIGAAYGGIFNCYEWGDTRSSDISYGDMPDISLGALAGGVPYERSLYDCYYNTDASQIIGEDELDEVYPIGLDYFYQSVGDDSYCTGKSESELKSQAFVSELNNNLQADEIQEAGTFFNTDGYRIVSVYSLNDYIDMMEDGLAGWEVKNGHVLPTAAAPEFATDDGTFASGKGTQEDPYVIATESQLQYFADSCEESTYEGQYLVLSADITLTKDWTPIVDFSGNLDGQGHHISNVKIGSEQAAATCDYAGFFGKLSKEAVVKNLNLDDVVIYAQSNDGARGYVGGLAAYTGTGRNDNVIIDGCSVNGGILSSYSNAFAYAGGITAYASMGYATIANSYSDVDVKAYNPNGLAMAGGIAATTGNGSFVMNCASYGDVTADGRNFNNKLSNYAGGLFAMPSGVIYNCYTEGNVTVKNAIEADASSIGAVFGQFTANGTASNIYYSQKVQLTVDGTEVDTVAIGKNTGNMYNVQAVNGSDANLAAKLENGLNQSAIRQMNEKKDNFLTQYYPTVQWQGWKVDGNRVIPSGEVYIEKQQENIFEKGDGTRENPYVIVNIEQFMKFAGSFNEAKDYAGEYIVLDQDIVLPDGEFNPLGQTENGYVPFCGNFNGQGHKITNLRIGSRDAYKADDYQMYYGLFSELGQDAVVSDLVIEDAQIYVEGDASIMAGILAGSVRNATIDGCQTSGNVGVRTVNSSEALTGANSFAGGIAGYAMYSNIVNSGSSANVDAFCRTANAEAGGIVGLAAFGVVANCYTTGNISGETDRTVDDGGVTYLAGLVGCHAQQMANCYELGSVNSQSWSIRVGALAGMATGISQTSYNYYNLDASQSIQGEKVSPVVGIGQIIGSGVGEDGAYDGAIADYNEGMTAAGLASQEFADTLNANFEHFPIDVAQKLPSGVTLKKWVVDNGKVVPGSETAEITYVALEQPKPVYNYLDGVYYGRALFNAETMDYVYVKATVEESRLTDITVTQTPDTFDTTVIKDIVAQTIEEQEAPEIEESDSFSAKVLKNAIAVVLNRALIGDKTGYDLVDPAEIFAGGKGTKEAPYEIATVQQLVKFAASINAEESYEGKYIVLTRNIDLSGIDWIPAGGPGAHTFRGTFDGKNHVISNMSVGTQQTAQTMNVAGLFAYPCGAVICNLGVKDALIHIERSDSNRAYAGIIAGAIDNENEEERSTLIDHCSVSGKIINVAQSWCDVGGIAGYAWQSVVANCNADVVIEGTSTSNYVDAGGIVGMGGFSALLNNYARGSIVATAGVNSATIGGIIGMNGGTSVNNFADVDLYAVRSTGDIGGITGRNTGIGIIDGAYYSAEAKQQSGNQVAETNKAVGTNVTMFSTGVIKNTEEKTRAEMKTTEFLNALNENASEHTEAFKEAVDGYPLNVLDTSLLKADTWIMAKNGPTQKNAVSLTTRSDDKSDTKHESSGNSGSQSSSGSGSSTSSSSSNGQNNNNKTAAEQPSRIVINPQGVPTAELAPTGTDQAAQQPVNVQTPTVKSDNRKSYTKVQASVEGEEQQEEAVSEEETLQQEETVTVEETTEEISTQEKETEEVTIPGEEAPKADSVTGNTSVLPIAIVVLLALAGIAVYLYVAKKRKA